MSIGYLPKTYFTYELMLTFAPKQNKLNRPKATDYGLAVHYSQPAIFPGLIAADCTFCSFSAAKPRRGK